MGWLTVLTIVFVLATVVLNIMTWRLNRVTRRRIAETNRINELIDNRPDKG